MQLNRVKEKIRFFERKYNNRTMLMVQIIVFYFFKNSRFSTIVHFIDKFVGEIVGPFFKTKFTQPVKQHFFCQLDVFPVNMV